MLEVDALNVYYGDAHTLWDVSLALGDGEIVSIVGSNGAGKTTLVNSVMGILRVRGGRVLVDGTDVATLPPHKVGRHGLAIVPEGRGIFPAMTVRDNLDLGAYRSDLRPQHDALVQRVHELFPILARRGRQLAGSLSGGEQQMLAIGRALMAQPRVLLLDEPSLGLAPVIVDEVFDVVQQINHTGVSVLIVEQNVMRALEVSQRGYLLSEGRIALEAAPDELIRSEEVRRACLGI
jgi:branched-chain amino acid transport system ATP-binding protein